MDRLLEWGIDRSLIESAREGQGPPTKMRNSRASWEVPGDAGTWIPRSSHSHHQALHQDAWDHLDLNTSLPGTAPGMREAPCYTYEAHLRASDIWLPQ